MEKYTLSFCITRYIFFRGLIDEPRHRGISWKTFCASSALQLRYVEWNFTWIQISRVLLVT